MESCLISSQREADTPTTGSSHVCRLIAELIWAIRVGKRVWRIRQADLERFLASGESHWKGGTK
ncbi:MAG: hypothetical protein WA705_08675 [Candidatus Ozemobacteraceae bacterium]